MATNQENESVSINNENGRNTRIFVERRRIPVNELTNIEANFSPRFGFRDRLFHAMVVRLSIPYHVSCPPLIRRFIEFLTLINAIILLTVLIYMHILVNNYPAQCLNQLNWPRKGIVRVEVIRNLEEYMELQSRKESNASLNVCTFDLAKILRTGRIPKELIRHDQDRGGGMMHDVQQNRRAAIERTRIMPLDLLIWLLDKLLDIVADERGVENVQPDENGEYASYDDDNNAIFSEAEFPLYYHLFEFSLHYGLLRLNAEMRHELNVETLLVQLDVQKEECLKDWRERPMMRYLVGMDELIMASVKKLSENETERGYLRDLIGGELYHFVNVGQPSASNYLTAMTVMLIFTFAISMLLRYSHDQIFVFIVDLFQMFEQNQPLIFPIAPLLTVILALVGMEAIMSEIFNDTSTAFYVILLVWVADQYDAIFCHSSIGRRYWLKFFYLYHFSFYAYQYRYNGLYSGLALLTSAAFTLHSMVFFFHHYELPHTVYQEELVTAVQYLENTAENNDGSIDILRIRRIASEREGATEPSQSLESDENSLPTRDRTLRNALLSLFNRRFPTNPSLSQHPAQSGELRANDETNGIEQNNEAHRRTNETTAEEMVANSVVGQAVQEAEEYLMRNSSSLGTTNSTT